MTRSADVAVGSIIDYQTAVCFISFIQWHVTQSDHGIISDAEVDATGRAEFAAAAAALLCE